MGLDPDLPAATDSPSEIAIQVEILKLTTTQLLCSTWNKSLTEPFFAWRIV